MPFSTTSTAPVTDEIALPTFADIEAAAKRIAGKAVVTPLLESEEVNKRIGGRVLIKPEVLQRTGSFKFRGAYNRISQIPERERAKGVVAYSSGNHAQGVAAAARLLGLPATIVMPSDAPAIKQVNTKGYGAEIVFYDRYGGSRDAVADEIVTRTGGTLVRPFDDAGIVAGQGTCGLEIARQAAERGIKLDALLVNCGGGGLIGGSALAMRALSPETKVYAVEPEGFDDTARSLAAGERLTNDPAARSICDALLSPSPGALTFALNSRLLAGGLAVSDRQVIEAIAYAFQVLKLVVEPGGAVTLAALLSGAFDARGKTVAIVLSGGNVDPEAFRSYLTAAG